MAAGLQQAFDVAGIAGFELQRPSGAALVDAGAHGGLGDIEVMVDDVDDQLLRDSHRLKGIPGVIAHGRYDVVCPLQNAWDLHKAWPEAQLEIAPTSGHSAFEAELTDILVRATDRFA
jgi:pimeloyl-ACP methyl ester carboxylesterase